MGLTGLQPHRGVNEEVQKRVGRQGRKQRKGWGALQHPESLMGHQRVSEEVHGNRSLGMERAGLEERISGKGIESLGIPLEGNSSMQGDEWEENGFKKKKKKPQWMSCGHRASLQARNIRATRWVTVGQSSLRGRRVVGWFSLPLTPCPLAFPCWKEPCSSPAVAKPP